MVTSIGRDGIGNDWVHLEEEDPFDDFVLVEDPDRPSEEEVMERRRKEFQRLYHEHITELQGTINRQLVTMEREFLMERELAATKQAEAEPADPKDFRTNLLDQLQVRNFTTLVGAHNGYVRAIPAKFLEPEVVVGPDLFYWPKEVKLYPVALPLESPLDREFCCKWLVHRPLDHSHLLAQSLSRVLSQIVQHREEGTSRTEFGRIRDRLSWMRLSEQSLGDELERMRQLRASEVYAQRVAMGLGVTKASALREAILYDLSQALPELMVGQKTFSLLRIYFPGEFASGELGPLLTTLGQVVRVSQAAMERQEIKRALGMEEIQKLEGRLRAEESQELRAALRRKLKELTSLRKWELLGPPPEVDVPANQELAQKVMSYMAAAGWLYWQYYRHRDRANERMLRLFNMASRACIDSYQELPTEAEELAEAFLDGEKVCCDKLNRAPLPEQGKVILSEVCRFRSLHAVWLAHFVSQLCGSQSLSLAKVSARWLRKKEEQDWFPVHPGIWDLASLKQDWYQVAQQVGLVEALNKWRGDIEVDAIRVQELLEE